MMIRLTFLLASGLLAIAPIAAGAQESLPKPVDAAEAAALPALIPVLSRQSTLTELDSLLQRFSRPTPLRGVVQSIRAHLLVDQQRYAEAKSAAEEAVRLTPGYARPRMLASYALTFAGDPRRAADYWLEASQISPETARTTPPYTLSAMIGRLVEIGDTGRGERVRVRMDEIGIASLLAPARSDAALARLKATLEAGDTTAARGTVASVINPEDLRELAMNRHYTPVWPTVAEWAGTNFTGAQERYLVELRREFQNRDDLEPAVNYARALSGARAYQAVVTLFLPLLNSDAIAADPNNVAFLTPVVATALTATGRYPEAIALLDRISAQYPSEGGGMRLNFSANIVRQAFAARQWREAADKAADWIKTARALGPTINVSAVNRVLTIRACAMYRLGDAAEATSTQATLSLDIRANYSNLIQIAACRSDLASARDVMARWLADTEAYAPALAVMAPATANPAAGADVQEFEALVAQLRTDPALQRLVAKVGRLPVQPVLEALPPGFDPLLTTPAPPAPLRPDSA